MKDVLRIGNSEYWKASTGVFKVPFSELGMARFCDLPYYSTIELGQLPGNKETYNLSINAIHGGGPGNEDFSLSFHVAFFQAGEVRNQIVVEKCNLKLRHITRFFQEIVDSGVVKEWDGHENRSHFNEKWYCSIIYSKQFTRHENPVLHQAISPFVDRFKAFLETPELCLFLCHASEDKEFVDLLATYLDSRDIDLWYDKREIKVGDSIVSRINDGLDAASHVLVVLSKASVNKPWVKKELSSALMNQLNDKSITIIPLLREDCKIPALLTDIKYADCRKDRDAGFRQMVDEIIGSKDVIRKNELLVRVHEKEIAMGEKVINIHSRVEKAIVGDNNIVTININKTTKKASKNKYPEGCIGCGIIKANYISYLIDRYHEFKEYEVGKENMNYAIFPSNLKKAFKIGRQRTIYHVPIGRFDELAYYIQSRIKGTMLGKMNKGKRINKNYDSFDEYVIANRTNT